MKITLTAETDAEKTQAPIAVEIPGMAVFTILGLRHDTAADALVPEERFQSTIPLGLPTLVGMLDIAKIKLRAVIMQPPQPSKIQRPIVMPHMNGIPRM